MEPREHSADRAMFAYHAHINAQFLVDVVTGIEGRDVCFLVGYVCKFLQSVSHEQILRYTNYLEEQVNPESRFGIEVEILEDEWEKYKNT
jgi:hypothetical protein